MAEIERRRRGKLLYFTEQSNYVESCSLTRGLCPLEQTGFIGNPFLIVEETNSLGNGWGCKLLFLYYENYHDLYYVLVNMRCQMTG